MCKTWSEGKEHLTRCHWFPPLSDPKVCLVALKPLAAPGLPSKYDWTTCVFLYHKKYATNQNNRDLTTTCIRSPSPNYGDCNIKRNLLWILDILNGMHIRTNRPVWIKSSNNRFIVHFQTPCDVGDCQFHAPQVWEVIMLLT